MIFEKKQTSPRRRHLPLDTAERTLRVLLAEDDRELRDVLALTLRHRGYDLVECENGMCLADWIGSTVMIGDEEAFDLIISDIRLPGVSGLEILDALHAWGGGPPVILITAFGDAETHERAKRMGVHALLDKPFEIEDLLAEVDTAVGGSPKDAA